MLDQITPIVLTYNEAPNIARTLERLRWAREVLVVDSFSSDETLGIVSRFPNTRVLQRRFDCFRDQWHHALEQGGIQTPWVLALDADYVLTPELIDELAQLAPPPEVAGYRVRFRYCIDGKPLHGTLYPDSVVLFRRELGRYRQDGHCYRLQLDAGRVEPLRGHVLHDDRKPLSRWLAAQDRYAGEEVEKLSSLPWSALSWPDRVRRVPFLAPPLVFAHCLALKGCALDGRAGLTYAGQRATAELIVSLKLLGRSRR